MGSYGSMVPEGMGDKLFRESEALRDTQQELVRLFKSRGFSEVVTPSLEFYDVFGGTETAMPQEMMYKLIDAKGRILVLRPDNTMPVVRVAATKLREYQPPLRLFYNQNVFRVTPSFSGRRDEIHQCGVELLGAQGIRADLEVILTAMDALRGAAGEFRFELGNVAFFKAVVEDLPCGAEEKENLRRYVETKNYAALTEALEGGAAASPASRALIELPRLFGDAEVIEAARAVAPNEAAARSIDYLSELYSMLCGMGFEKTVMLDLGLVQQIHYYTGLVFRGYLKGSGEPVLSGGRYDRLFGRFGADMAACGFGVNADAVSSLGAENARSNRPDVLLFYELPFLRQAYARLNELTETGLTCELCAFGTLEEATRYARRKGIPRIDCVAAEIRILPVAMEPEAGH